MNTPTIWQNEIYSSDLPANAKLVAITLRKYLNGHKNDCYPSLNRLSKETSLTEKTIIKWLKMLVLGGWLIKESGKKARKVNRYWIMFPYPPKDKDGNEIDLPVLSVKNTNGTMENLHTNKQSNKQINKQPNYLKASRLAETSLNAAGRLFDRSWAEGIDAGDSDKKKGTPEEE